MPFPKKDYFSLNEVSARWRRKMKDVEYCIENGLLDAHVKVCSVKLAHISNVNYSNDDQYSVYEFTGCKRLAPEDCHVLFRHYKRQISEFVSEDTTQREKLIVPEKLIIKRVDLMIFLHDLNKFEEKYQLKYEEPELPLWEKHDSPSLSNIASDQDCGVFYIGSKFYSFGPIQTKIIRELYKAAQTSKPWVLGKNLLVDSGARTQHLKDLFKFHPILPLIKYGARGYYRLLI